MGAYPPVTGGTAPFTITGTTDVVQQIVKGSNGQTQNIAQWQDNTGVPMFSINNNGMPKWNAAGNQQLTVGPAGAAAALPITPTKYMKVIDSTGAPLVFPVYAVS